MQVAMMFVAGGWAGAQSAATRSAMKAGFVPMYPELAQTAMNDDLPWVDRIVAGAMFGLPFSGHMLAVVGRGISAGSKFTTSLRSGESQLRRAKLPSEVQDAYVTTGAEPYQFHFTTPESARAIRAEGPNTPGFWLSADATNARKSARGDAQVTARLVEDAVVLRDGKVAWHLYMEALKRVEHETSILRTQGREGEMTNELREQILAETFRNRGFDAVEGPNGLFISDTTKVEVEGGIKPAAPKPIANRVETRYATEEELPAAVGGEGGTLVGETQPLLKVAQQVVTTKNPILRALVGKTGINPSILQNTMFGRLLVGYRRNEVAGEELVKVALAAGLDVHAQRFTARMGHILPINSEGQLANVTLKAAAKTQSTRWQDVFTRPGDYTMPEALRAYIKDYHRIITEGEAMRVRAGLKPRATNTEAGWFYIPRQVKALFGVELKRPSDPNLQRVFETVEEGHVHGVRYDLDPRATLEAHLRTAYREVNLAELSEAVTSLSANTHAPLAITPKQLVGEPILKAMSDVTVQRIRAERDVRNIKNVIRAEGFTKGIIRDVDVALRQLGILSPKTRGPASRIKEAIASGRSRRRTELYEQLRDAQAKLDGAMDSYRTTSNKYRASMKRARKAEVAPGKLFGRHEARIPIKMWKNYFLPKELYDQLGDTLRGVGAPRAMNWYALTFNTVGNAVRFLSAVGDLAVPFIQGLPVLGTDPVAWGKASLRHYQALLDPTVQARCIHSRLGTFQTLAKHGIPIGDPEFFAFMRTGENVPVGKVLTYLPGGKQLRAALQQGGRQAFGRFQSSYNTGLGMYRALLWDSLRPNWRGTEVQLAAHIRNLTGGLDSRALGVGPTQRGIESMWLGFSPRLIRSTVALVADMRPNGLRSAQGRAAWKSLLGLAGAVTGIYVLTGLAMGKSWEEIGIGLNPLEGKKFLSHEINGDWVGIGGQVRAIIQFCARAGSDPLSLGEWDQFENPLIRAYMERGAVGVNMAGGAIEAATNEKINILPFDDIDNPGSFFAHLGFSALPFTLQGYLEGESPTTTPFAFFGLRTSEARWYEERSTIAEKEYGAEWETLTSAERKEFYEKYPEYKKESEEGIERAAEFGEPWAMRLVEIEDTHTAYNLVLEGGVNMDREAQREQMKKARNYLSVELARIDREYIDVVAEIEEERAKNPPKTRADELLTERQIIFDTYVDPSTGLPLDAQAEEDMYVALDKWEGSLSAEDQATLDENTGLRDVPEWVQEYREDMRTLEPLWTFLDKMWTPEFIENSRTSSCTAQAARVFASPEAFQKQLADKLAQNFQQAGLGTYADVSMDARKKDSPTYGEQFGNNPLPKMLAETLAAKFAAKQMNDYWEIRADTRNNWLENARPDLLRLLVEWRISVGRNPPAALLDVIGTFR